MEELNMPHNTTPANRTAVNVPKWTRNILFLTVGIALVIASVLFQAKNYLALQAIALNLGLVTIAVVLVELLWELCGGTPVENQVSDLSKQIGRNDLKSRFQVRLFTHVPLYCSIFRVDDMHYVTQYLFSAASDNSPLYCVKGDATWPKFFAQEFTAIWDTSEDLFTAGP
jgi:hypothetical protein